MKRLPQCIGFVHLSNAAHRKQRYKSDFEQRPLVLISDAGRRDVGVEVRLSLMVRRHFVELAAFLEEADPVPLTLGVEVCRIHADGC